MGIIPNPQELTSHITGLPSNTDYFRARALSDQEAQFAAENDTKRQAIADRRAAQLQKQFDEANKTVTDLLKFDYNKVYLNNDRQEVVKNIESFENELANRLHKDRGELTWQNRIWASDETNRIKNLISMGEKNSDLYATKAKDATLGLDQDKYDASTTMELWNNGMEKAGKGGIQDRFNFLAPFAPVPKQTAFNPLDFFQTSKEGSGVKLQPKMENTEGGKKEVYDFDKTKENILQFADTPAGEQWKDKYDNLVRKPLGLGPSTKDQFADYMAKAGTGAWKDSYHGKMSVNVNVGDGNATPAPSAGEDPNTVQTYTSDPISTVVHGAHGAAVSTPAKTYHYSGPSTVTLPGIELTLNNEPGDFDFNANKKLDRASTAPSSKTLGIQYLNTDGTGNLMSDESASRDKTKAKKQMPFIITQEEVYEDGVPVPGKFRRIAHPLTLNNWKALNKKIATSGKNISQILGGYKYFYKKPNGKEVELDAPAFDKETFVKAFLNGQVIVKN